MLCERVGTIHFQSVTFVRCCCNCWYHSILLHLRRSQSYKDVCRCLVGSQATTKLFSIYIYDICCLSYTRNAVVHFNIKIIIRSIASNFVRTQCIKQHNQRMSRSFMKAPHTITECCLNCATNAFTCIHKGAHHDSFLVGPSFLSAGFASLSSVSLLFLLFLTNFHFDGTSRRWFYSDARLSFFLWLFVFRCAFVLADAVCSVVVIALFVHLLSNFAPVCLFHLYLFVSPDTISSRWGFFVSSSTALFFPILLFHFSFRNC